MRSFADRSIGLAAVVAGLSLWASTPAPASMIDASARALTSSGFADERLASLIAGMRSGNLEQVGRTLFRGRNRSALDRDIDGAQIMCATRVRAKRATPTS